MHWVSNIPLLLHPFVVHHLYNQGFADHETIQDFIYPKLTKMHNPFQIEFGKEKEHVQMKIKQQIAYGFSKSSYLQIGANII